MTAAEPRSEAIEVRVNGEPRTFAPGVSVVDVLGPQAAQGVAVARNGEVVPRGEWATTLLERGDEIEIVRPVQGG